MKRRVLRAHANKRCLRILSASNQLRTPSSLDRAHAVLCDSSFLRAVLLSYWQAHAPAAWREARKRQIRKAAAAAAAASNAAGESPSPQRPDASASKNADDLEAPHQLLQEGEEESASNTENKAVKGDGATRKAARGSSSSSSSLANTAAIIARLPLQMPSLSPYEFLTALLHDAFHGSGGGDSAAFGGDDEGERNARSARHFPGANGSGGKGVSFVYYCLPETVTALHRMQDGASSSSSSSGSSVSTAGPKGGAEASSTASAAARGSGHPGNGLMEKLPPHRLNETERWLAASFGDIGRANANANAGGAGGVHSETASVHGHRPGTAVAPLTFQEIPSRVVNALLCRLSLLQDPTTDAALAGADTKRSGHEKQKAVPPPPPPQRNEAKTIADFMSFNNAALAHGGSVSLQDSFGFGQVRLCTMPPFAPHTAAPGHHALKRQRKNRRQQLESNPGSEGKQQQQQQQQQQELSGGRGAAWTAGTTTPLPSKPYLPRSVFVATQCHDVRRRLPPATALLRLTTNPDALWIEQRGTAYNYADGGDGGDGAGARRGPSAHASSSSPSADATSRHDRQGSRHAKRHRTASLPPTASAAPTVVSAAPQLSRADVAFMKHLGTAANLPLPEKASASSQPPATAASTPAAGAAASSPKGASVEGGGVFSVGRKRSRQKGQNPLSMKKKQKREVFRA